MFGWSRKASVPKDFSLYSPKERFIYAYFDGEKTVHEDPVVLYKRLEEVRPELAIDMRVSVSPSKDARSAHDASVRKVRTIFGLKDFSAGGLTETEVFDLFDHFWDYLDAVKKNLSLFATSSISTPGPATPSSADAPITSPSSGSGSIADAPSTGGPGPSPTASPSPSVV